MIRPKDLAKRTRQFLRPVDRAPAEAEHDRRITALEQEVKALRGELGAVVRMIEPDGEH